MNIPALIARRLLPSGCLCIAAILLILTPVGLFAQNPQWWGERHVLNSNPANDYGAANQGQLKNIATAAKSEFDAFLPGQSGDAIRNMVDGWLLPTSKTSDYATLNLGQLKAVAAPFYQRLIEVGYTDSVPWAKSSNPSNDYAMANIGQIKSLFSFELRTANLQ